MAEWAVFAGLSDGRLMRAGSEWYVREYAYEPVLVRLIEDPAGEYRGSASPTATGHR